MTASSAIVANKTKTNLIIGLFVLFVMTVGFIYGKAQGFGFEYAGFAFMIGGLFSFVSYYFSDKLVLATSGAKPVKKSDNPVLYRIVEHLAAQDNLPMPGVYMIQDQSLNAFATGRDPQHAVVCVTSALMARLDKAELEGVLAHELSHVKNFDTRLMGIVAILVGFVVLLGNIFMRSMWFGGSNRDREDNLAPILMLVGVIFAVLSPIVATLIQLAISRKREFLADASGALLTRYPQGLASALEKLSNDPHTLRSATNATAHLFIVNPFKGKSVVWFASLFNTHPPIEERIKNLRSM